MSLPDNTEEISHENEIKVVSWLDSKKEEMRKRREQFLKNNFEGPKSVIFELNEIGELNL